MIWVFYLLISPLLVLFILFYFFNINFLSVTTNNELDFLPDYGEISDQTTREASSTVNELVVKNQINFVGDVMLARHVEYLMSVHGSDYPYSSIDFFDYENSYTIGNFEASMPVKHFKTPNFNFSFSVNSKYLSSLKKAGFTHMSLANNHAFDFGYEGYKNAKSQLEKNYLTTFGQPNNLSTSSFSYLNLPNHKVAVMGIHGVASVPSNDELETVFNTVNINSDFQVVYIHWGNEYEHQQSKSQRLLATKLSNLGADLIIGHHPHVAQGIERINDTIVFYSLGNFIFDQYFSQAVREGLVVNLTENSVSDLEINLIPITTKETLAQPTRMNDFEKNVFLEKLAGYSDYKMQESIMLAKIELNDMLATSSETAIIAE
jgi:poly-gamma-glutamate synthesis protein (capsule biosynthesis protein)